MSRSSISPFSPSTRFFPPHSLSPNRTLFFQYPPVSPEASNRRTSTSTPATLHRALLLPRLSKLYWFLQTLSSRFPTPLQFEKGARRRPIRSKLRVPSLAFVGAFDSNPIPPITASVFAFWPHSAYAGPAGPLTSLSSLPSHVLFFTVTKNVTYTL